MAAPQVAGAVAKRTEAKLLGIKAARPEVHLGWPGVLDHEKESDSRWAATVSIATKIGCTPETLRKWILRTEVGSGRRGGLTSEYRALIKEL